MINRGFSEIVKDHPKNWLGIKTKDTSKRMDARLCLCRSENGENNYKKII